MADDPKEIDENALELVERRLSEKIEANVRARLFRNYLAIGGAVLVVLGYVGFNIVGEVKKNVEASVATKIATIDGKLEEINEKATKIDVIADVVQNSAFKLQTVADDARPQLTLVKTYGDQVANLDSKIKDLQSSLATLNSIDRDKLDKLVDQVAALANEVQKLATAIGEGTATGTPTQTTAEQVAKSSGDVSTNVLQSIDIAGKLAVQQKTVFIQYFGMPKETADAIAKSLRGAGYIVPALDSEATAAGLSEVRYYYDADKPTAAALAEAATKAVRAVIPDAKEVAVRSLTNWPNRKPSAGTLELWIGGAAVPAAQ